MRPCLSSGLRVCVCVCPIPMPTALYSFWYSILLGTTTGFVLVYLSFVFPIPIVTALQVLLVLCAAWHHHSLRPCKLSLSLSVSHSHCNCSTTLLWFNIFSVTTGCDLVCQTDVRALRVRTPTFVPKLDLARSAALPPLSQGRGWRSSDRHACVLPQCRRRPGARAIIL